MPQTLIGLFFRFALNIFQICFKICRILCGQKKIICCTFFSDFWQKMVKYLAQKCFFFFIHIRADFKGASKGLWHKNIHHYVGVMTHGNLSLFLSYHTIIPQTVPYFMTQWKITLLIFLHNRTDPVCTLRSQVRKPALRLCKFMNWRFDLAFRDKLFLNMHKKLINMQLYK